ncbi:Lactose permease [Daldinia childiae]|uniref:Lactose permease n=1 Tax=Daldinia childiae TaxID=326645 RepID=UPI001446D9A9|nr:Lactose permease [Daldinia childiae]KAF3054899.1 Lactose permease [Daldinia childiae]
MAIIGAKEHHVDPRLANIAKADTKRWYQKPNLRALYLILIPAAMGVEWTSGFDSSMMNSLQAVEAWVTYFDNPTEGRLGLLNAMYSLGALMAVPFIPTISQYLGRRWSILAGSLVLCLGAGLQTGSQNSDMFLASRWVLGFGIPLAIVNASALIGELAYEKERPTMTSLFTSSWHVGAIVAAGVTYGTFQMTSTWSWRLPSILQLVPSLCQILSLPFCPESPRYLISVDRSDEAYAILQKYHSEGDNGEEFVRLEFAQIQSTIAQERETAKAFVWADVFRDPPMRRRFLLAAIVGFFTQWSGNGLLSFYSVWTVASARFAIENTSAAAIAVLVFIFAYSPFYNLGWNALAYTYLVEIFPYQQRAKGIAVEQLTVRFAVFFNTYVNPVALDRIGWKYYLVYCVWILFEVATVYFLFPETYNRTLEELSFIFEGKEVQDKVQNNVDKQLEAEHADKKAADGTEEIGV